jgi:hypothetical protein
MSTAMRSRAQVSTLAALAAALAIAAILIFVRPRPGEVPRLAPIEETAAAAPRATTGEAPLAPLRLRPAPIDDGDVLAEGARYSVTKADIDHLFASLGDPRTFTTVPERRVSFRVRDRRGAPIAGATAFLEYLDTTSKPTGEDGRSTIDAGPAKRLLVGKAGFVATLAPIPEDDDGPIEVELRPANQLTIDVRLPDDSVPAGVLVSLSADSPIFGTGSTSARRARFRSDLTPVTPSGDARISAGGVRIDVGDRVRHVPRRHHVTFRPDATGRIVTSELEPGEIVATLHGPSGAIVLDEKTIAIGEEATEAIVLRSRIQPRVLEGMVETRDPAPRALMVEIRADGVLSHQRGVGADGRFTIENVFAKSSVEVSFYDYESRATVSRTLAATELGTRPGGTPHVFVLAEMPKAETRRAQEWLYSPEYNEGR